MENRVLIYAPTGQDARLVARVLAAAAALESVICHSPAELGQQLEQGVGGVITVEEALQEGVCQVLGAWLARQPGWSDLPITLLTHAGNESLAVRHAIATLGNLNLLERPVRTLTLITAVHAMLRARAKQYQVRETERRKDEFLASLGHELRNPLAPIQTSAALLRHMYPDTEQVLKVCAVIERQLAHLTRLVDDLLDVARITSGKIKLQRSDIRFTAVIDHVSEMCAPGAAEKQIRLGFDLPATDIILHADYARVVQIIANIVGNAIKFTPPGGRIAVKTWLDDGTLCIRVSDTGIGLEPGAIERIFSMFEQSRNPAGQIASGLGIGLSLARRFAEMHGGSVEASSEGPGKGSQFLIRLPQAASHGARAPAASRAGRAGDAGRRPYVLVVDDNRDAADSLRELLQTEQFDVAAAYDGGAALAALDTRRPDAIVMDLGMPDLDGYQAARLIRQRPGAGAIRMIALTGWGQTDARRRTREAGFDHHMIKPVDFGKLIQLIRQAVTEPADRDRDKDQDQAKARAGARTP